MGVVLGSPFGIDFVKRVKLTFTDSLIKQPLIYEMAKLYSVTTNIEKANIDETEGWVIMEVNGTGDEMDKALQWMADQGVRVQTMFPNL